MDRARVDPAIVERLRAQCMELPEVFEEVAWTGVRWKIRSKTFAHVLEISDGWPPIYARAVGCAGPLSVVTFQSPHPELFRAGGDGRLHYFGFGRDTVGVTIDAATDWDELGDWLSESYCLLAPKRLAAAVAASRRLRDAQAD